MKSRDLIAEITVKMIAYSKGNLHDINHFLKVFSFAKTIGEREEITAEQQTILEVAALLHDIACPLCREKYGNTNGKYQEAEGETLARKFLETIEMPQEMIDRVVFLVSHHHTWTGVDGADYQILLEADYLVNAYESNLSKENIKNTGERLFQTQTGKALLNEIYLTY